MFDKDIAQKIETTDQQRDAAFSHRKAFDAELNRLLKHDGMHVLPAEPNFIENVLTVKIVFNDGKKRDAETAGHVAHRLQHLGIFVPKEEGRGVLEEGLVMTLAGDPVKDNLLPLFDRAEEVVHKAANVKQMTKRKVLAELVTGLLHEHAIHVMVSPNEFDPMIGMKHKGLLVQMPTVTTSNERSEDGQKLIDYAQTLGLFEEGAVDFRFHSKGLREEAIVLPLKDDIDDALDKAFELVTEIKPHKGHHFSPKHLNRLASSIGWKLDDAPVAEQPPHSKHEWAKRMLKKATPPNNDGPPTSPLR